MRFSSKGDESEVFSLHYNGLIFCTVAVSGYLERFSSNIVSRKVVRRKRWSSHLLMAGGPGLEVTPLSPSQRAQRDTGCSFSQERTILCGSVAAAIVARCYLAP